MRYFGSKVSAIEDIYSVIAERVPGGSLCDPFGGIGTVGSYFKSKNYEVYSGDHLTFAHFFQISRIAQNNIPKFETLCDALHVENCDQIISILNNVKWKEGWLVQNYSYDRKFFTLQNSGKIESCRQMIEFWNKQGWISYDENAILVASLINSMDRVANTAGTYYAYLKEWYRKALKPFNFELLEYTPGNLHCECFLDDAQDLVKHNTFDILYLDPPYNERTYADYYHLPETIALNMTPKTRGKAGLPCIDRKRSSFNKRSDALNTLKNLLNNAQFSLLVFHYSDNGIMPPNDLRKLLNEFGTVDENVLDCIGYVNKSKSRRVKHRLYLVES